MADRAFPFFWIVLPYTAHGQIYINGDRMIHLEPALSIYFGDASNKFYQKEYLSWHDNLLHKEPFSPLLRLKIKNLTFLHQVHGSNGFIITKKTLDSPFFYDGDYLITNQLNVCIGVMTADCVPVICHDKRNNVIGIAHAGWRGAVKGVVIEMIKAMHQEYGTSLNDMRVFFGPCAKRCCYEVQSDFKQNLEHYSFGSECMYLIGGAYFFDLPAFLSKQLVSMGLEGDAIRLDYTLCTMCNNRFWSHRKGVQEGHPERVGRQM